MEPLLPPGATLEAAEAYAGGLLVGQHVRLRPVMESDLPALAGWWARPEIGIHQTATVMPRPHAETVEMLRAWTRNEHVADGVAYAVEERDGQGLLGWISLFGAAWPHRRADLGVSLRPDKVGEGFGREAVELIVRYGFAELGLHRIQLAVYAYNQRGIAAYERVGFVREGVRRSCTFHGGTFHDEVLMGLLADEWEARP